MPQQVLISSNDPELISAIEYSCGCVDAIIPAIGLNTPGLPRIVIVFQKVSVITCCRCADDLEAFR